MLSWACTVPKVQGLSLNSAVISFDLVKQKSFNQGQMYVALCRVTDIKNLHLIGTYNRHAFQVNSNVTSVYNRLCDSSYFIPWSTLSVNSSSLTVSLLSVRSLRRHLQDILKDKDLMENDLLCLKEIQVCHENDVSDIKQQLDTYEVHWNVESDRYQNIGLCLSRSIMVNEHEKFPGVSILEIEQDSLCSGTARFCFFSAAQILH